MSSPLPPEETLLTARRFQVRRVSYQRPDGSTSEREVIRHPGSVVIVPFVDDQHVCLIHNYRVAAGRKLIELPAGTLEAQEAPLTCALRELTEETGYRTTQMEEVTAFYAAPGILDEYMHLFVARELTQGQPQREPDEDIENLIVSWPQVMQMIQRRDIRDAKTIAGLLFAYQWCVLPGLR